MIRITLFIVFVGAIAALAVFLVDEPGHVEIVWGDWLITTSPGALTAAAIILACLTAISWQIIRWVMKSPNGINNVRKLAKQKKGYRVLTDGFLAAAVGDVGKTKRLARRARKMLHEPALTLLLSAQAAQLEGKNGEAEKVFDSMLERPETELLGIRGLLIKAIQNGQHSVSRDLAERAYRIRPDVEWVLSSLLELRVRDGDYIGALKVLRESTRSNVISPDRERKQRAALLVEASRKLKIEGKQREAQRLAIKSTEADPEFIPAAIAAAEISLEMGRLNAASKIIERLWRSVPHPVLGEIYRRIHENRDILTQIKRLERLTLLFPDHVESQLLMGSAELDAKLWGPARKHLLMAEKNSPSARVYRLLARLEYDENQDSQTAHSWLLKSSEAPHEEVWRCSNCGVVHPKWHLICSSCAAIDTIDWGNPFVGGKNLSDTSILTESEQIVLRQNTPEN